MKQVFLLFVPFFLAFQGSLFAAEPKNTKSEARKEVDAALDKVENQIQALEKKSKELSKEARAEWESAIEDLKKNGNKLREEIKEERAASAAKAKDFWTRIKAAVNELQSGVDAAGKKLKDEKK